MKRVLNIIKSNKYYIKIKSDSFWGILFKNSFWAFLGDSVAAFLGLIITVILIRILGNVSFGVLILGQTYMGIMDVLLNIQSWKSVIHYGQSSLVLKKYDDFQGYVKLGVIIDISTAIIGGIVAIIIAPIVGMIFNFSSELIVCSQIFCICIFFHFSGTPTAILRLFNKFNLFALQKTITAFIKMLVLLLLMIFYKGIDLIDVVLIYSVTDIIGNIILVVFAFCVYHSHFSVISLLKSKVPSGMKKFLQFTLWGTLGDISDIPVNYLDVFIVSLISQEIVSVFKVFKQCIAILQKVASPIQQSILPQFSELIARGDLQRGYYVVKKIRNTIFKIICPMSLIIGMTSPIWLKIIFGEIYAEHWYVLLIYLVVQTFALSYTTIHPYFLSLGKAKQSTLYVLIANLLYIIIALLLVKSMGIIGIVLAFLVQCFVVIYLKIRNIRCIIRQ